MGNKNFEPILCKQQADSKQFYNLITNNKQTDKQQTTFGQLDILSWYANVDKSVIGKVKIWKEVSVWIGVSVST